jgi:hypothetical protein
VSATIERTIEVQVPIETAYNQWTQFEEFPRFMEGVEEVRQLDDRRLLDGIVELIVLEIDVPVDPRSLSSQELPRIAELARFVPADRDGEFELGLELILTGPRAELARLRRARRASRRAAPAKPSA